MFFNSGGQMLSSDITKDGKSTRGIAARISVIERDYMRRDTFYGMRNFLLL